ncbi:uncharacterized protein N0V89_003410 [Didymosphaeria variabile]|uniref:NAD(P)-binding protein n=1 Tax=Didymosphaeria variabile TaxID=1932322 RepID=A0A9W8XNB3_9PLEO|nr:uncharacterized protein N0V89_003410 [Didymosphaeria variabile]KAJ4355394.1 hypothetical protein N0V89_003410 [Didymosphaeria variabile]
MPPLTTLLSFYTSLTKSLLTLLFARLYKPQELPPRNLTNQTAIVTGSNSGIGLSIAIALAKQGATVCLACRNADRGAAAVDHVVSRCGEKSRKRVYCKLLDVGDLSSVRAFCEEWDGQVDMLVHNAGIAAVPKGRAKTKEGLDVMYTTNFLGSFLMTHLLEPQFSPTARVVFTSSTGSYSATSHFLQDPDRKKTPTTGLLAGTIARAKKFVGIEESSAAAYGLSKGQQVLFASMLQQRFGSSSHPKRTAHAFTPGFTSTPIFGKFDYSWRTWFSNPLFAALKTTEKWIAVDTDEGAKTGAWLATWGDELGRRCEAGAYWERMARRTSFVALMKEKRKSREWAMWERDAGVVWED